MHEKALKTLEFRAQQLKEIMDLRLQHPPVSEEEILLLSHELDELFKEYFRLKQEPYISAE